MKKKVMIVSILAVFMLVGISIAVAGTASIEKTSNESPLYKVRSMAIKEKASEVKSKFLEGRAVYLPVILLKIINRNELKMISFPSCSFEKCDLNGQNSAEEPTTRSFEHYLTITKACQDVN
jgi:hypothetical protein